jgi:hypothetical protein
LALATAPDLFVCAIGGSHAAPAALAMVTSAWATKADYACGPDRTSGPPGLSPEAWGQIVGPLLFLVFQFSNLFFQYKFEGICLNF